ncbi:MAG TPA: DinB family protein [Fimbriimonas sp.]|nr:DinB family protein [Fimbriimonas sp.]
MEEIREMLRQVIEGADFPGSAQILKSVKPQSACTVLPGMPYSVATNVAHTEIWNRVWLHRLQGLPKVAPFPDFPDISQDEWPAVKAAFVEGVQRAYEIACAEPWTHRCKSDESAKRLLTKIALHTSYHLGQVNLLKRALRVAKR